MTLAEGLAVLRAQGVRVDSAAPSRFDAFLDLLEKWNRTYNLTAIRERERMVTHHLLDSLTVLPYLGSGGVRLLDVGSGAGIPGIPLAIAMPTLATTLVDSNHKKGTFMQQAVAELGLANVAVRVGRIEAIGTEAAGQFDIVVSRAFSDLATFSAAALPALAPGGRLLAMKGVMPHEELAALPPGVALTATHVLAVPGLDAERHLVVLEAA
ncbi:MAG: 16S rRNA (guanine(527)-N(7))-methyltransferase RsmG [Casimicrobiaceae bacterium]